MSLPVEVRGASPGEQRATPAQTRNVSFRGVYFTANRKFELGSPIVFVLTLPKEMTLSGDVRVQCVGRVVRVEKIESEKPGVKGADGGRVGVAAMIEQYDFLPPTS